MWLLVVGFVSSSALGAKGFSCFHHVYGIAIVLLMCKVKCQRPDRKALTKIIRLCNGVMRKDPNKQFLSPSRLFLLLHFLLNQADKLNASPQQGI